MALQMGTTLRNARLDQVETTVGTSAVIQIFSGSAPANCAAADSGTLLAEWDLASDWAANASGGTKGLNGLPLAASSVPGTGSAGYFRLKDSTKTTCHMQGTVTATGGGGDITIDNTSIVAGQVVNITSGTWTEPGA